MRALHGFMSHPPSRIPPARAGLGKRRKEPVTLLLHINHKQLGGKVCIASAASRTQQLRAKVCSTSAGMIGQGKDDGALRIPLSSPSTLWCPL
eukprot:1247405-Pyramimonas_sp.AAC.1